MPVPFDHALALTLAVLFPWRALRLGLRRLHQAPPERRLLARVRAYRHAIALQWTFTLAVLALWAVRARPWDELGLVPHPGRGMGLAAIAILALLAVAVVQLAAVRRSEAALERAASRMRAIEPMLPHEARDLRWFRGLAVTAGVCEETLYRGYLLWYALHWLPLGWAVAVTSVAFGIGHLYQGWRGVITTAVLGALLALVYLGSGSLFLGMLVHAGLDLYSGELAHAALSHAASVAEREAAAEPAAGTPAGREPDVVEEPASWPETRA